MTSFVLYLFALAGFSLSPDCDRVYGDLDLCEPQFISETAEEQSDADTDPREYTPDGSVVRGGYTTDISNGF